LKNIIRRIIRPLYILREEKKYRVYVYIGDTVRIEEK